MLIEGGSHIVERIHDDQPCRRDRRSGDAPAERVVQQITAEALTLKTSIEREASEQDRGNSPRAGSSDTTRELFRFDEVRSQREERHDVAIAAMPHERPAGVHRRGMPSKGPKPIVERGLPTREPVQCMLGAQELRDELGRQRGV